MSFKPIKELMAEFKRSHAFIQRWKDAGCPGFQTIKGVLHGDPDQIQTWRQGRSANFKGATGLIFKPSRKSAAAAATTYQKSLSRATSAPRISTPRPQHKATTATATKPRSKVVTKPSNRGHYIDAGQCYQSADELCAEFHVEFSTLKDWDQQGCPGFKQVFGEYCGKATDIRKWLKARAQ